MRHEFSDNPIVSVRFSSVQFALQSLKTLTWLDVHVYVCVCPKVPYRCVYSADLALGKWYLSHSSIMRLKYLIFEKFLD